jgi:hypothetical protein
LLVLLPLNQLASAFRNILEHDRKTHGVNDYTISDVALNAIQREVNGAINTSATNAAAASREDAMDVEQQAED